MATSSKHYVKLNETSNSLVKHIINAQSDTKFVGVNISENYKNLHVHFVTVHILINNQQCIHEHTYTVFFPKEV